MSILVRTSTHQSNNKNNKHDIEGARRGGVERKAKYRITIQFEEATFGLKKRDHVKELLKG